MKLYETYIDDLDRSQLKKYEGEPLYRLTAFRNEDGRTQMYTVGLSAPSEDDADKVNFFEPAVRAARYTTEESFVFKDEHAAGKFLKMFQARYNSIEDFDLKKFNVSEYNPFREIIDTIPIHSPIGDAFVAEQKKEEKPYDKKDEEEDED